MSDLVERIISDPNSSFCEEDAAQLAKLPKATLQRMAIGLNPRAVSVENADSREEALRADLHDCQQDVMTLLATEQDIRKELEGAFGVHESSVIEQFVPVTNAAAPKAEVSEQAVSDFVRNSKTPTATVLREALAARDRSRAKAIEIIVTNAQGMYSEAELRQKFTPELMKLADFVQQQRRSVQNDIPVYNYEGVGLADRFVSTASDMGRFDEPLNVPSTYQ